MYSPASAREMNIEANTNKKQDKMIFFILASSLRICEGCRVSIWNCHARDTDVAKIKVTQGLLFLITLIAENNSIHAKNGTSRMERYDEAQHL
jgi:hypothetical protein